MILTLVDTNRIPRVSTSWLFGKYDESIAWSRVSMSVRLVVYWHVLGDTRSRHLRIVGACDEL